MTRTAGWHGTLVTFLEGIAASKPQPADEPNVVSFQTDVKKLVDQIRVARRDVQAARLKRQQLTEAWGELDQELIADEGRTAERLTQLQAQFAKVAHDCGLEVVVPSHAE